MDHRHGLRTPVSFSVRIYHRGRLLGNGTARNISRGGAFVELTREPVPADNFVELELLGRDPAQRRSRRLPGLVVHRQSGGFGVMFAEQD